MFKTSRYTGKNFNIYDNVIKNIFSSKLIVESSFNEKKFK